MSQFSDYALQLLRGGLPAVLDTSKTSTGQGDTAPERLAPTGTLQDQEPFNLSKIATTQNLLIGGGVLVGVVVLVLILRR